MSRGPTDPVIATGKSSRSERHLQGRQHSEGKAQFQLKQQREGNILGKDEHTRDFAGD